MSHMLREILVRFQALSLTRGGSVQHNCDMVAPTSPDSAHAFADRYARILAAWRDSGLLASEHAEKEAHEAAMKLAWLSLEPPRPDEPAGRGRPPNADANMAAAI